MDRRTLLMGAGAGAVALGTYALMRPGQSPMPLLPQAANAQESTGDLPEVIEMVLGDPDAPVEVIEYASFTCPHCRTFHENTLPRLKADFIDTGQVRMVYREVYFDRPGLWASMVARCAGPMRYFGVVDLIYARQAEWVQGSPAQIADSLRRIGRTAGMTNEQLDACLTDAAMAQALIERDQMNREVHDIPGTPHFVINGTMHPNMSYEDFSALIEDALAAAQ
jgi:protein-disulfide isomerase